MNNKIVSLRVAKPSTISLAGVDHPSGVNKIRSYEPIFCGFGGLVGDYFGDTENHGTPDKALLIYPLAHYARWSKEIGSTLPHGSFGENLVVQGMTERNVSIGDQFRMGDVLIQITQPRYPCWKIAQHSGIPDLLTRIGIYPRTGFYAKVLEEGILSPDAELSLVERPYPSHTIAAAFRARVERKRHKAIFQELVQNPFLSEEWRQLLLKEDEDVKEF